MKIIAKLDSKMIMNLWITKKMPVISEWLEFKESLIQEYNNSDYYISFMDLLPKLPQEGLIKVYLYINTLKNG